MDVQMQLLLIGTFVGAALLSLLLIPVCRISGLVDAPCARKTHVLHTPLAGGIAMFVAFGVGVWLSGVLGSQGLPILLGAALLVAIGLVDDRHDVDFRIRFLVQGVAAACLVIGAGVRVGSLGNLFGFGSIDLGLLSIPFSIFAVVGMVNAINMLDGLDGLAGSVALVILAAISVLAARAESVVLTPALLLSAAVLGFLVLNFRFPWRKHALVFMGDAGSNFLGYCLAWFVIALPQQAPDSVAPVHMLWLVGFPVADTLATMWRRFRQGLSPFHPGHDHAHHWLLRAGLGTRATVLLLVLASCAYALLGINGAVNGLPPEPALIYLFVVALTCMALLLPRVATLTRLTRHPLQESRVMSKFWQFWL
jgi:UDP-GlcNAc:undecaprenyl-phosphate GlcNAc-1-phosphate transferase